MYATVPGDAILARPAEGTLLHRADSAHWDADQAVTTIYQEQYRSLVRLAVLLVSDVSTAEDVVQDSFVAMHNAWRRLRDDDKALAYLRQSVVNRSRSVLRHRGVTHRREPQPIPDMPSAEYGALTELDRARVIRALGCLSPRQREVMVLRYYADLREAEIAAVMHISPGAVKSHASRAIAAMKAALQADDEGGTARSA